MAKSKLKLKLQKNDYLNTYTEIDVIKRLTELAINVYKWSGLPDTIDERYLELQLCQRGKVNFFKDKDVGFLCLAVNEYGPLNVYNIPTLKSIFGANGFHRRRNMKNSVTIYNNFLHTPSILTLNLYAMRIADVQRTIDTNVNLQKIPFVFTGTENQQLAIKNIFKKIDDNEVAIFTDTEMNLDNFKCLNTNVPFIIDKLVLYKKDLWNEVYTFLGINNANQDKKERLVEAEVGANDDVIENTRFNGLDARQIACKQINKMFGLNISCSYRNDDMQKAFEDYKIKMMFGEESDENE